MAISTSLPISLNQVETELGLSGTTSLLDCFANANSYGFDATYGTIDSDNLQAFRGYDDSITLTGTSIGYSVSSAASACVASSSTKYIDNGGTFNGCSRIYNDSAGTSKASTGYYSNGSVSAFWNSTTEVLTGFPSC